MKLLSPSGSPECLKAAVFAGADEVYFGLDSFNARKNAKNFTFDEAVEAIGFCRLYGVKTNITLNTLLYRNEYLPVLETVEKLEKNSPPDAYIVQDLGLVYALSRKFPGIEIHASTQMQVMGSYGNEILRNLGISRVVLAREVSENDIDSFVKSGMETEIFVHGAMCVCRSGGCLMSSMIGRRSGNRGECAYPCRMEYNGKGKFPMSLKDMCLAGKIAEIKSIGVHALKIEGRMKSPEYVYGVTKIYRKLIDENRNATENELEELKKLFSRSGFTDGYFVGRIAKSMFGVRTEADKEKTREYEESIKILPKFIKTDVLVNCGENAMSLTLSANGVTVTVTENIREDAIGDGTDEKTIEKQLKKFGGTVFECENFEIKEFVGGFYPVSKLNMLRRNALEELKNKIYEKNKPNRSHKANLPSFFEKTYEKDTRPVIRIEGKNADTMYFDEVKRIEIPLINETVWKSERLSGYISKISLILPGFIFDGNVNDIKERLEIAKNYGIKSVTIPNITFIPLCDGFEIHADYMTNCISSNTARVIKSHKISSLCASPEAKSVGFSDGFDEKIVYGRVVLMNTRTCIIKNITDCTENEGFILTDRTNASFPIFCSYLHSNLIYNSVPIWLFDKKTDESLSPVLVFTDENEKRQREIFKKYIEKSSPDIEKFTRAEY